MCGNSTQIENVTDGNLRLLVPRGSFLAGDDEHPCELPPYDWAIRPCESDRLACHRCSSSVPFVQSVVESVGWPAVPESGMSRTLAYPTVRMSCMASE